MKSTPSVLITGLMILSTQIFALEPDDIADKTKPFWTDFESEFVHQFMVVAPFDNLNKSLCALERTRPDKFTNLGLAAGQAEASAYLAGIDEGQCNSPSRKYGDVVRSTQTSAEEALVVETWNGYPTISKDDSRRRMRLENEAVNAVSLPDLKHEWEVWNKASNHLLLRWNSESRRSAGGGAVYEMMFSVDRFLWSQAFPLNKAEEVFSARLIYENAESGSGTIVRKYFQGFDPDPEVDRFPAGTPVTAIVTNASFDRDLIRYEQSIDIYASFSMPWKQACISRQDYWTYIPWFGYGFYDHEGNRVLESFEGIFTQIDGAEVSFDHTEEGDTFGKGPLQCRSMEHGGVVEVSQCSGIKAPFEFFPPRVDLPNFSTVIRVDSGEEYIVRILRTRRAYKGYPLEVCSHLPQVSAISVPNHRFFEGRELKAELPRSGAILVNDFSGNSALDPIYGGYIYGAFDDSDGDGVLNFQDAFPTDSSLSADLDYDGVADESDGVDDRFIPDHSKYIWPNAVEVQTPSMAAPE